MHNVARIATPLTLAASYLADIATFQDPVKSYGCCAACLADMALREAGEADQWNSLAGLWLAERCACGRCAPSYVAQLRAMVHGN
jgi:hypothetical protein